MFSTKVVALRGLSRAQCQLRCLPATRRMYATEYEQRTKETLKTSSRLTWITTAAAVVAGGYYYTSSASPSSTSSSSPSSSSSSSPSSASSPARADKDKPLHHHDPGAEDPKPVEDRHGNSVEKHSIAAHKNQNKVREGKFSGKEFDNHELKHTPGEPGGDFERRK